MVDSSLGAAAVWYGTHAGVGISRDSLYYIRGAENLAGGNGYAVMSETGELEAVNHWPPFLYSMVIAAPIAAGLSATQSVRLVNSISFLLTLWLSALLVLRLSGGSRTAALIAMAFIVASPAILHNHLMTWSETTFVPLVLAGFLKMLA